MTQAPLLYVVSCYTCSYQGLVQASDKHETPNYCPICRSEQIGFTPKPTRWPITVT